MRLAPTTGESKLWERLEPLGFERQLPLGGQTKNGGIWMYILDFWHLKTNLVVEVDGGYHKKRKGYDRRRDTRLATAGLHTIRFTNREVDQDLDGVVARIVALLA